MRPTVYAAIAVILLILAVVGVREVAGFRAEVDTRERFEAQRALDEAVELWAADAEGRIQLWIAELPSQEAVASKERVLRGLTPWFEGFYVWEAGEVAWPPQPPAENLVSFRAEPCAAAAVAAGADGNAEAGGYAWLRCARSGRGRAFAYFAVSEATEAFLAAGRPDLGARAISILNAGGGFALAQGPELGVSTYRLVALRHQYSRAMTAMGQVDVAERVLVDTAEELLALPGPQLEEVLEDPYLTSIRRELEALRGAPPDDEEAVARARRRIQAYRRVRDGAWDADAAPVFWAGTRPLIDDAGEPPWVLFYSRLNVNNVLAAVQVDQGELLLALLGRVPDRLRPFLTVRTLDGRVVAGARGEMQVYRGLGRVMPHLVAGLVVGSAPVERYDRALFAQVMLVIAGLAVGAAALRSLVRSDREQQALLESQREFMARVTHELKTPLAGIRLMAETLEMGAYRDEAQRETFARQIQKEADRLQARVEEVLAAAAGPRREERVEVDAAALLRELVERWRPLYAQAGGEIELVAPERAPLRAMVGPLRDALTNLFDNALKYRHPDRPLRVQARLAQDRRWTVFTVTDNGLGVPRSHRKAVFERFKRVEGAGRGKSGGHGLGLSFVADAAAGHGGKVECRDGVDGGASFVLRIPTKRS